MSDDFPRRLREDDPEARRVLGADAHDGPPPDVEQAMLTALIERLPPGGGGSPPGDAGPAGAPSAASSALSGLKFAVLGAAITGAVLTGQALLWPTSSAPPAPAVVASRASVATDTPARGAPPDAARSIVVAAPSAPRPNVSEERDRGPAPLARTIVEEQPRADVADEAPVAEPVAIAEPTPSDAKAVLVVPVASAMSDADRTTMLREEGLALGAARDALRSGDASRALARLDDARVRFPRGMLAQEREALTIEALWTLGRHAEASTRGAAFLRAFPTSPFAARVRSFQ